MGCRRPHQDALLDVLHPVVVLLQHRLCPGQVQVLIAVLAPRDGRQPVQVIAGDAATGQTRAGEQGSAGCPTPATAHLRGWHLLRPKPEPRRAHPGQRAVTALRAVWAQTTWRELAQSLTQTLGTREHGGCSGPGSTGSGDRERAGVRMVRHPDSGQVGDRGGRSALPGE